MLKWTAVGQRGGGTTTAMTTTTTATATTTTTTTTTTSSWRQTATDESPTRFLAKPRRCRRPGRRSGRQDKENSDATPTTKTCRRRQSLRDVSNHNSPAAVLQMSPVGRRTKSPCADAHWMPAVQKRRYSDDVLSTDDAVKRKKPCTGDHAIVIAAAATGTAAADEQLCVSMSPTEEPVQLSHKRLPVPAAGRPRRPDDERASRAIDLFVDQIRMDDGTFDRGGGDRLSVVSPLAKRLADIRLRRSPADVSSAVGRKRKRAYFTSFSDDDADDTIYRPPMRTPPSTAGAVGRPAAWWWLQCSGGGLTLPDGLASPFCPSRYGRRGPAQRHRLLMAAPPSPITPLRRRPRRLPVDDDDSADDYWKTPRGGGPPSTASSKTTVVDDYDDDDDDDDDELMCCSSDPRSPAALDDTFAVKSRRCLSFASPPPPPSDRKTRNRRSPRKRSAAVDKASGLEVFIGLKDLTHLTVLLKRGRNLTCADGEPPNTYLKVYLVPGKGTCHRTRVRHNSVNPRFDESFAVPLAGEDRDKRILISAWHRDRSKRRSEFLGYMSFAVKNVVKKEINGTFKLVPQSPGRMPPHSTPATRPQDLTVAKANSTDDEGDVMIDDDHAPSNYSVSTKVKCKPKKDAPAAKTGAEENRFLQYLELDPPLTSRDGRSGRTPFTVTKRLSKPSGSSFGFSIAWTHPPRVERVECGLPADQADLKPGDYVVFINKTNVVMMAEDDVMALIKSCSNQLSLEVYNKTTTASRRNHQPPPRSASIPGVLSLAGAAAAVVSQSDTTVSLQEPPRRRFHIPQVTFTSENLSGDMDSRLRWIHQLLTAEQQFVLCLQFGIGRYLLPLAERKDVLKPKEHAALFQNVQELLRTAEDTLERIIDDDWKMLARNTCKVYLQKIDQMNGAYYRYCKGVIRADCVLVEKIRNADFLDLVREPPIPDRRPDLIAFVHKPFEHYRNVLKCMQLIQINTEHDDDDFEALSHIVHEMQATHRFITVESGLTEPEVDGKPLLSLNDLEARLVFTRCKPFALNTPDRRWVFAGDLSRVEGRSVRSYWALLFSDILLFTKVSRDRVLFVTDEPLPLSSIVRTQFSVKKKDTEFRLVINSSGSDAASCHSSPAATGCSPLLSDLSGTLSRLPKNKGRVIVLRAPKPELKAVWQNLVQRQILALDKNALTPRGGGGGGPPSSSEPPDSPDDLLANSLATLDDEAYADRLKSFAESLVDERCRRMAKCSACDKGKALHISQWIKGELGGGKDGFGFGPDADADEPTELWPAERMDAKRAEVMRRLLTTAVDAAETVSGCSQDDGQSAVDDDDDEPERSTARPRGRHRRRRQQRAPSTSGPDAGNRDRSTDSLDRAEFCSTADYRWPEDFCPVTASCCLPTDEDYDYDASSEEFWGTPNSSTTSPLSLEVSRIGEPADGTTPAADRATSATPATGPRHRPEPPAEVIESSDDTTPSHGCRRMVYGEGRTLLSSRADNGTGTNSSGDKHHAGDDAADCKPTSKNIFNALWRTSRGGRPRRARGNESKFGASFIRRRRAKSEKSKQNKEIKLNLIESVYLLLFG